MGLIIAEIPVLSFSLDSREEQFGVLDEVFDFHFCSHCYRLGRKKKIQNALVVHLGKTEKCVNLFLSAGRLCLTLRKHTVFCLFSP